MGRGPRSSTALMLLLGMFAVAACGQRLTRTLTTPDEAGTLDGRSPFLKVHLRGGDVYLLSDWRVDGGRVSGTGSLLDLNRAAVREGAFDVPVDSALLFETNVVSRSGASTALTVMAGVTAAVAGICAASPKTCFGSCPTYYVDDGEGRELLQAEGFSASIAPGLEATDIDMLERVRAGDSLLRVRVTNEALETHVIRHTDLLAAPRRDGARVFLTPEGVFLETSEPVPASSCSGAEGDCSVALAASDGVERFSLADSSDLATREVIDLVFDEVPDGELGLVIQARQTLMTTYLIYQALAYLGQNAGRWLAALASSDGAALGDVGSMGHLLGQVEVMVPDSTGEWVVAGAVGETGPLATDTKVVPLGRVGTAGQLRVRLRLTRGLWRLDRVGLAQVGEPVRPVRILPTMVRREGVAEAEALRLLTDRSEPLVTLPGDEYEISYRLPEHPSRYELFLEARGYYLEWMRQEWMAEENAVAAARMLLDPAGMLRALAPEFKRLEPEIEELFWNSRYEREVDGAGVP